MKPTVATAAAAVATTATTAASEPATATATAAPVEPEVGAEIEALAGVEAEEPSAGGQDQARPSRPPLAQAKSVAADGCPADPQAKLAGSGWPPIAPPRARKRQSMPFVGRATAAELASAASATAKCRPTTDCIAEIHADSPSSVEVRAATDCAGVGGGGGGPAAPQDEAVRQAGAISTLFTKILGKSAALQVLFFQGSP